MTNGSTRLAWVLLAAVLSFAAGGCIKIRITVQLNEDGSGRVLEETVFGEKLVNVSKRVHSGPTVETLTSEARVRERMTHMGEGVSLVSRDVEPLPDGSVRMRVVYAYQDINTLKISPVPFGPGWEDASLKFSYSADSSIAMRCTLLAQLTNDVPRKVDNPPLSELEAQQVRLLLPILRDLVAGFELSLRLEVFDESQWACLTRGFPTAEMAELSRAGGRLTFYQFTDSNLFASEDGMLLVVPWRQIGREFDLFHYGWPPGAQIMPYVNFIQGNTFRFTWRAIQGPHGREYY